MSAPFVFGQNKGLAVSDEGKDWFVSIPNKEKQRFLASLAHDLTIHGRYFGFIAKDLTAEQRIRGFIGLNELHHQISQHIGHLVDDSARYPDDVLWQILQENAAAYGITWYLNDSIKKLRSSRRFQT